MKWTWLLVWVSTVITGNLFVSETAEAALSGCENASTDSEWLSCLRTRLKIDKNGNLVIQGANLYITDGTTALDDANLVASTDSTHHLDTTSGADKDYSQLGGKLCDSAGATKDFYPCETNADCSASASCVATSDLGTCLTGANQWQPCQISNATTDCGSGVTCSALVNTGVGNMFVDYGVLDTREGHRLDTRTGNHNLLVGQGHHFQSDDGLIAGFENHIRGSSDNSTVTGGQWNHVKGEGNVIVGGLKNLTKGDLCSAGLTQATCHVADDCDISTCSVGGDPCVTTDDCASGTCGVAYTGTCAGTAAPETKWSVVVGGTNNGANDFYSVILGGAANHTGQDWSAIAGGYFNDTSGLYSSVAGGNTNLASGQSSAVLGGTGNEAAGEDSTILGGYQSDADGEQAICGGYNNQVTSASGAGVALGGSGNTVSGNNATVMGGGSNTASGSTASISGGSANTASGSGSHISGGTYNTASGGDSSISGGNNNTSSGGASVCVGGHYNDADGYYSVVVGGGGSTTGNTNGGYTGNVVLGTQSTNGSGTYLVEP